MKALAGYIVKGRWQAILVTTVCGVLAFMLPPVSSLLNYLAAAAVALVTLQIGKAQGLQVLVISSVLTLLFYQLVGIQAAVIVVTLVMLWLPCWLIAAVLQQTGSLGHALKAASLFGVCLLLLLYAFFGDPAPWWLERLREIEAVLKEAGFNLQELMNEQVLQNIAALMSGIVLASLVLGITASLLLARWWQSALVHPGGFRDEFFQLRLGAPAGLLTLGIMLLTRVLQGTAGELAAQLAMILLVPYALTGLAVIHYLVRQAGRSSGWLAAVYIILAFVPQATLLLAGGGLLDTWVDFRRR
ncbi:MAG: DUF2232 domain-containing protein, partial [Gammaproteobacteria bacterium]|nr:DUF2232 domain-containing protein [Gammaproteobacteria bacterium]